MFEMVELYHCFGRAGRNVNCIHDSFPSKKTPRSKKLLGPTRSKGFSFCNFAQGSISEEALVGLGEQEGGCLVYQRLDPFTAKRIHLAQLFYSLFFG